MSDNFTYLQYVTDNAFLSEYNAYQAKYSQTIRESDKVTMQLVERAARPYRSAGRPIRLLDVGCSTGNLLKHLHNMFPEFSLVGGDLAESSLAQCRANPELAGVDFQVLDLLDLPASPRYDIITVNAVLYMMNDDEFDRAAVSVARALKPGGTLIIFDFFHQFEHDLSITEISASHPEGLRLRFRRMDRAAERLAQAGFAAPEFNSFTLPIDLPPDQNTSQLVTYTVPTADGRRLPFRGTLFQPWCHVVAVKRDDDDRRARTS